jgi:hypothetical protein
MYINKKNVNVCEYDYIYISVTDSLINIFILFRKLFLINQAK